MTITSSKETCYRTFWAKRRFSNSRRLALWGCYPVGQMSTWILLGTPGGFLFKAFYTGKWGAVKSRKRLINAPTPTLPFGSQTKYTHFKTKVQAGKLWNSIDFFLTYKIPSYTLLNHGSCVWSQSLVLQYARWAQLVQGGYHQGAFDQLL